MECKMCLMFCSEEVRCWRKIAKDKNERPDGERMIFIKKDYQHTNAERKQAINEQKNKELKEKGEAEN